MAHPTALNDTPPGGRPPETPPREGTYPWQGQIDTKATYANLSNNLESWVAQAKTRLL